MLRVFRVLPLLALTVVAGCPTDLKLGSDAGSGACTGPMSYTAGSTATGTTGVNSCRGPDGSNGQLYAMTLAQQTNLQFTLTANGFPGFLGIYTGSGVRIAERNASPPMAKVFLPAGSYQVFVGSMSNADGTYSLASVNTEVSDCTTGGATTKGATIAGTLTASDCGNSLSRGDSYEFYLSAGQSASVSFTVDRVSGMFVMGNGGVLANKEVTAAGTWSTTVTATTAGYYGLRVESRTVNGSANLPVTYSISIN